VSKKRKRLLTSVIAVLAVLACLVMVAHNFVALYGEYMKLKVRLKGYSNPDVLGIGSSSMSMWKTYREDLAPYTSENTGIPGTVVRDWEGHLDSLVLPFSPKILLVYLGANDLHKDNPDPEGAAGRLTELLDAVHEALPGCAVYAISVCSTPSATDHIPDDDTFNAALAASCEGRDWMHYVDMNTPLLDGAGKVQPSLFRDDGTHLNDDGYLIWAKVIRAALGLE